MACSLDSIKLFGLGQLLFDQVIAELEDGVLLLPLIYFFLCAVLTWVRSGVTEPALGDSFYEYGTLASTYILDHLVHRLTYS